MKMEQRLICGIGGYYEKSHSSTSPPLYIRYHGLLLAEPSFHSTVPAQLNEQAKALWKFVVSAKSGRPGLLGGGWVRDPSVERRLVIL